MGPETHWNGTIVNTTNPPRRDTAFLQRYGHLVIQFETDNPGVWPFHCHNAWHASMGFSMSILEGRAELKGDEILDRTEEGCKQWEDWTSKNEVEQIDSGI